MGNDGHGILVEMQLARDFRPSIFREGWVTWLIPSSNWPEPSGFIFQSERFGYHWVSFRPMETCSFFLLGGSIATSQLLSALRVHILWMFMCAQPTCVQIEINARFLPQSLSIFYFETISHWTWSSPVVVCGSPFISESPSLSSGRAQAMLSFSHGFWGSELRPPHLRGKHFAHWALSAGLVPGEICMLHWGGLRHTRSNAVQNFPLAWREISLSGPSFALGLLSLIFLSHLPPIQAWRWFYLSHC